MEKIDRRNFIKTIVGFGIAVGSSLSSMAHKSSSLDASRIVIVKHPEAVSGMSLNSRIVRKTVNEGVMSYTGQKSVADAYASILTPFSLDDIVTIKVNCINSQLPTHIEVVDAVVEGLISAGVKDSNIIIWDRTNHELIKCGYRYNISKSGVRCFGTDQKGWGYDKQARIANQNVRLSKILTSSDHIINIPVLKDHGTAGVTLSMKNHYGSVDNPGSLHGDQCNPYIPELNNVPEIRDKTRLIVLDGFLGIYTGGPGGTPQFAYNGVIIGQDPVAVDYQGWSIIDSERRKRGQIMPQPKHIVTSAKIGIGVNDPGNIQVETVEIKGGPAV